MKQIISMKCFDPVLTKIIDSDILMTVKLIKYNSANKRQQRLLVLTPLCIYNILPQGTLISKFYPRNRIKRCIPLARLDGLTVSTISFEFIVHVRDEYDYHYSSHDQKDLIIHSIADAYCKVTAQKSMPIYSVGEVSLNSLVTTELDLKRGISRRTKESKGQYSPSERLVGSKDEVLFRRESGHPSVSIKEFEMIRVISKGYYGKVMLCQHRDQHFVIKSQRKQEIATISQVERRIMEQVDSPFVMPLQYTLQSEGKIFFVSKFMACGDLYGIIQKARNLSEEQSKFITAQLLMALDYLHSNGIVHRDIKLQNVLVSERGYVKLTDFGVAKLMTMLEYDNALAGTAEYMAPELASGQKYNFAVDYWSLGVIVFEMVYGKVPFSHAIQRELVKKIIGEEVEFVRGAGVSETAIDFISRLLTKDPKHRMASLAEAKQHKWMSKFPWKQVQSQEEQSPFYPTPLRIEKARLSDEFVHEMLCSPNGAPTTKVDYSTSQQVFEYD